MGVGKNLEINQQKQQQQIKTQKEQMREHLTMLQNWDLAEDQTLEQRRTEHRNLLITQQKERNERLRNEAKDRLGTANATKTAEGNPVQMQMPANKTFKQRREDKRLDKLAKEKTPVADHASVRMYEALKDNKTRQNNSLNLMSEEQKEQASQAKVDVRVLRNFVYGYRTDRKGKPASQRDEARKNADKKFLDDYCSRDVERRRPHLNRMLEQVLRIQLTESMMTPEYLEDHLGEVQAQIGKMVYFENVYKDPVNKPYFDALPQLTKDLIEHRVLARYASLGLVMTHICAMKGVDSDHLSYMTHIRDQSQLEVFSSLLQVEKEALHNDLNRTAQEEEAAVQRELDRRMELAKAKEMETAEKMKAEAETMKDDIGGLGLTSFVTGYSFDELAKYRTMIEEHHLEYVKNPQLIDALYQGMHHGIDALGDVTLRIKAAQEVMDEVNKNLNQTTATDRVIFQAAGKEQEKAAAEADLLRERLTSHADALLALLRGKPLSDAAADLLRGMGHQV